MDIVKVDVLTAERGCSLRDGEEVYGMDGDAQRSQGERRGRNGVDGGGGVDNKGSSVVNGNGERRRMRPLFYCLQADSVNA